MTESPLFATLSKLSAIALAATVGLTVLAVFSLVVIEAVFFPGATCLDRGDIWIEEVGLCEDMDGNRYRTPIL